MFVTDTSHAGQGQNLACKDSSDGQVSKVG